MTGSVLNLLSEDNSEAEMCMPGDNIKMTVELHTPIAMEENLRFAIREGRQDRRRRRRDQDPCLSDREPDPTERAGTAPRRRPLDLAIRRPDGCGAALHARERA